MKKIFSSVFAICLVVSFTSAVAQRDYRSAVRPGRNEVFPGQRNYYSLPQRNSTPPQHFNSQFQRNQSSKQYGTPDQRFSRQRSLIPQRNITIERNYNYPPQINHYGYSRGYTNRNTYHFVSKPRVVISIGGPYRTIPYRGNSYNYYNGYWYQPLGSSFQIVMPPAGIRINTLPPGYRSAYGTLGNYYYYNNVFYRQPRNATGYEVVAAPFGAQVSELPTGAEVRVIDAVKYYELDGTFYKEDLHDGQIWYTVAGRDGILDTDNDQAQKSVDDLPNGTRISILPNGSKPVILNGQKFYAAPNGNYYQEVIVEEKLWYELAGR